METVKINGTELRLISGVGNYEAGRACVMSAAVALWRYRQGEPLGEATDELECVCPVIRRALIGLNDSNLWTDDAHRTRVLGPYVESILDTKDAELRPTRAYIAADYAVRKFAPIALRARGFEGEAKKLEELPQIVDVATAEAGRDAAREARCVAAAYDAYVAAAYDAYAAAAAAAAAAADAREQLIPLVCEMVDKMIAAKKDESAQPETRAEHR